MKIVLLDTATLGADLPLDMFCGIGTVEKYERTSDDELISRICDTDVIVVNKVKLNQTNLCFAKNLKLICVTATGFDNIDIDYCKSRGIAVSNVVGYSSDSVMQLTVSMAMSLVMHISQYDKYTKSGAYTASGVQNCLSPVYHEFSTLTWGIVGMGAIGRRVAEVAKALGASVITFNRTPKPGYNCVDIDELVSCSDIISVHTPLNDGTRNLISRERISKMKETAVLINVARGAVVDEKALAEAVLCGKIGGIGIDVYSTEPYPKDHPYTKLSGMDNVILTPHMAWGAYEARVRCMQEILENINAYFDGKRRNRIC